MILDRFYSQLAFPSPYVENRHAGRLVQRAPRLVEQLILKHHAQPGAEDQNLKWNF